MSELDELYRKLSNNQGILDTARKKLRESEDAYESLRIFRTVVERSETEFNSANSGKLIKNADLNSLKKECNCAKIYVEGTEETLNGIGAKVISRTFNGLGDLIALKLGAYKVQIQTYEKTIQTTEQTILFLERAIREAQQALDSLNI